ncbi:MAG: hypothetical protein KA715_05640 [Xanthomonadaceae bacterium]|nr:hypothetical protein [Xanthomonadaceae bacterium]
MSTWQSEKLFFHSTPFFESLVSDIRTAKRTILYECYIFESGNLADKIESELLRALNRGVSVKLMVDTIGSPSKFSSPVPFKRFNPWLKWLNQRNHRKVCVIDDEIAYVGGMNVDDSHQNWRDTGVRLTGGPIHNLTFAFIWAWSKKWKPLEKSFLPVSPLVRLNIGRLDRRRLYLDLLRRIRSSQSNIWLTSAYFIPARSLVRALRVASKRGVDIRILVPGISDVFFTKWISYAFYKALIDSGIKIYEYQPHVLHSKTAIIDDWYIVGTSNLNHRSLSLDLEVDIVLEKTASKTMLKEQFTQDITLSIEITPSVLDSKSWIEKFLGRLLLVFRAWT